MSIMSLKQLEIGYSTTLVGPIELEVPAGLFVLIEGPNGVGKSTLLHTLLGLIPSRAGTYHWNVAPRDLRFVPQTRTVNTLMPATVIDVMRTGLLSGTRGWGKQVRDGKAQIGEALELVGITQMARQLFRELSEGQKQLVLLARALLGRPAVILLDEPSASMDPEREQKAISLLQYAQREWGSTILMIAHGSAPARDAANCLLRISSDGQAHVSATDERRDNELSGAASVQEDICGKQ